MKICFIITMYNEYKCVLNNLETINNFKEIEAYSYIIHSFNNDKKELQYIEKIKNNCYHYKQFEDLSKSISKYQIAAHSLTRNYNYGFLKMYEDELNQDLIVGMCGDTFIKDISFVKRLKEQMNKNNHVCMVSQAIGQMFHSTHSCPEKEIFGGRPQTEDTTDIMPQLFVIDGKFADQTRVFANIRITNPYTSEECLGDALNCQLRRKNLIFRETVGILNNRFKWDAYSFNDGVIYNAKI